MNAKRSTIRPNLASCNITTARTGRPFHVCNKSFEIAARAWWTGDTCSPHCPRSSEAADPAAQVQLAKLRCNRRAMSQLVRKRSHGASTQRLIHNVSHIIPVGRPRHLNRCPAIQIPHMNICPVLNQHAHNISISTLTRVMKRSQSYIIYRTNVGPTIDQCLRNRLWYTYATCSKKRR